MSHAIVLVDSDRRLSHITTATCPGVLLPVANRPLLSYVIEFLEGSGVSNVVLVRACVHVGALPRLKVSASPCPLHYPRGHGVLIGIDADRVGRQCCE